MTPRHRHTAPPDRLEGAGEAAGLRPRSLYESQLLRRLDGDVPARFR